MWHSNELTMQGKYGQRHVLLLDVNANKEFFFFPRPRFYLQHPPNVVEKKKKGQTITIQKHITTPVTIVIS